MSRNFKLSNYGCIRYRAHTWAKIVSQAAMDGYTSDGQMTRRLAETLQEKIMLPLLDTITTTQPPDHWPILQAMAMRTVRTAAIHAAWVRYGRQIFEFSPNLVSAFRLTDVTNASFEGLHLPYRAFFLHFGLQTDFVLDDPDRFSPEFVDGAYIFQDAIGTIVIELTLSRLGEEASNLPGVQIAIDLDLAKLGADEAINQAIDKELKDKEKTDTSQPTKRDLNQEVSIQSAALLEKARSVLIETASLISNALFYLSEPKDDLITKIEEGAPSNLANKAIHGKPNQKQQAKQSLTAAGYAVVRYCGELFSHPVAVGDSPSEFTKSHWRRGHWRNQRHGQQLSSIKRIWIRPVLVKAEVGAPEMGRVYVVSPSNDS
jgi:hypothetical protein